MRQADVGDVDLNPRPEPHFAKLWALAAPWDICMTMLGLGTQLSEDEGEEETEIGDMESLRRLTERGEGEASGNDILSGCAQMHSMVSKRMQDKRVRLELKREVSVKALPKNSLVAGAKATKKATFVRKTPKSFGK